MILYTDLRRSIKFQARRDRYYCCTVVDYKKLYRLSTLPVDSNRFTLFPPNVGEQVSLKEAFLPWEPRGRWVTGLYQVTLWEARRPLRDALLFLDFVFNIATRSGKVVFVMTAT